jgi:hypothetical protein
LSQNLRQPLHEEQLWESTTCSVLEQVGVGNKRKKPNCSNY